MKLKRKKLQQQCEKLSKEHEQKLDVFCDFQFEINVSSKLRTLTCLYCYLELKATKMWEAKIRQFINVHMSRRCHQPNVYSLFNSKEFSEMFTVINVIK